jgi:hypothetical protein
LFRWPGEASLRVEFHDVGAVIYFLRKVIWTIPGFTIDRYRGQPAALHERGSVCAPLPADAHHSAPSTHAARQASGLCG